METLRQDLGVNIIPITHMSSEGAAVAIEGAVAYRPGDSSALGEGAVEASQVLGVDNTNGRRGAIGEFPARGMEV